LFFAAGAAGVRGDVRRAGCFPERARFADGGSSRSGGILLELYPSPVTLR